MSGGSAYGGIRDESTIEDYLEMGIKRLVIGTRALTDPDWSSRMIDRFPGHLIIGIDARLPVTFAPNVAERNFFCDFFNISGIVMWISASSESIDSLNACPCI